MIIVSDSTVLINYAVLGLFHTLKSLFGLIVVPRTVYKEVYGEGNHKPGSAEVHAAKLAGWIDVHDYVNIKFYNRADIRHLHLGEREAITIAYEKGQGHLLTDDKDAIEVCERILAVIGIYHLTTFDVCELMREKKIIKINEIERSMRLRQLNPPKYKVSSARQ